MRKNTFIAHPITVFYQLRAWWFVFTAPAVRVMVQYAVLRKVELFLFSEIATFVFAITMSVWGWLCTRVIISADEIIIKKGIFLKSCTTISFSALSGVSCSKNLLYAVFGCAVCRFNTESKTNSKYEVKLKTKDVKKIYHIVCGQTDFFMFERHEKLKIYLIMPVILLCTMILIVFIRFLIYKIYSYNLIVLLLLVVIYTTVCFYDYKKGCLHIGEYVFVKCGKTFVIRSFCCKKEKIAMFRIIRTPFDRYAGKCKIKIVLAGDSGESIKIRHIEYKNATDKIKSLYKINDEE